MSTSRGGTHHTPIPKFASFAPKAAEEDHKSTVPKDKDEDSKRGHGHRRDRSLEQYVNDKAHRHRHKRIRPEKQPPTVLEATDTAPRSEIVFFSDRKGDQQNIAFGSIHRYDIPPFHRTGAGSVLGLPRRFKIDRETEKEDNEIIITYKQHTVGHKEKYAFSRAGRNGLRLVRSLPEDVFKSNAVNTNADFIPFKIYKVKQLTEHDENNLSDENDEHYRSIRGKAVPSKTPVDEDMEYVSSSSSDPDSTRRTVIYDKRLRLKTIELSRLTESRPRDVQTWLDFIEHQDTLLENTNETRRKTTSAERQSTADVKIHLYEKALQRVEPSLANKERLFLGLMAEGAKIWDYKTQSARWNRITSEHLDSLVLWKHYLDFQQSNFNAFRYEQVRDMYLARIRLLKASCANGTTTEESRFKAIEQLIYTILRATIFIREAGFTELAVGIWQGLLELNFFAPQDPVAKSLEGLQEFWDAEVPRVGDENARGWSSYSQDSDVDAPESRKDTGVSAAEFRVESLFADWSTAEFHRSMASREPARTMDDVAEDDPYRVILWSDIEEFMVDFGSLSAPDVTHLLLDAFLMFCRLPPVPGADKNVSQRWWSEKFIRGEMVDCQTSFLARAMSQEDPPASLFEEAETSPPITCKSLPSSFMPDPESLYSRANTHVYLSKWSDLYQTSCSTELSATDSSPVKYDWLREVLRSLVRVYTSVRFAEYWLAFENCNEPKTIKKTAKAVLKRYSTSLRLYNAYAIIEAGHGNMEIAVGVLKAALALQSSVSDDEGDNIIMLWKTWAWMMLDIGDHRQSFRLILSICAENGGKIVEPDSISAPLILKSRQALISTRDYLQLAGKSDLAVVYTECIALLAYTSTDNPRDVETALRAFTSLSKNLVDSPHRTNTNTSAHELLHQAAARLLRYHIRTSHSYRPATIREFIATSLSYFPHNTILLELYAFNERRLRMDDRVRAMLLSTVLTPDHDCLTSRLFAIAYELRSGNPHSVRAAFESAVGSPACDSSAGLWRFYILFCVSRKEYRGTAKEVFYRAIRACPWSKNLMMVAFDSLRELMTFSELRSIYKILGEKELRVHVDLEDALDVWDEARKPSRLR